MHIIHITLFTSRSQKHRLPLLRRPQGDNHLVKYGLRRGHGGLLPPGLEKCAKSHTDGTSQNSVPIY